MPNPKEERTLGLGSGVEVRVRASGDVEGAHVVGRGGAAVAAGFIFGFDDHR